MLKRSVPFTPESAITTGGKAKEHNTRAAQSKKNREYHSPLVKTPLRNVLKEGEIAPIESGSPLNDDEKERRLHRRALIDQQRNQRKKILSPATHSPTIVPSPTRALIGSNAGQTGGTPLSPAAAALLLGRNSGGNRAPANASTLAFASATAATVPVQKLSAEQRSKMFEEWMKIAADNKINAKNSWNVALIDYFSELTFLRDGDSINFQKASCTLDGCVKIYATRVDSVADETGKLLNENSLDDVELPTDGLEEGNNSNRKPTSISKKRPHKAVDTLAPSFDVLTMKNFEMEFSMDPLFRKTCAEFDDGNAGGFLCSKLTFSSDGRLVFDSLTAEPFDVLDESEQNSESDLVPDLLIEGLLTMDKVPISPSLADWSFEANSENNSSMTSKKLAKSLAEALGRLATMSMSIEQMEVDSSSDDDLAGDIHGGDALRIGLLGQETTEIKVPTFNGLSTNTVVLPEYETIPAYGDDYDDYDGEEAPIEEGPMPDKMINAVEEATTTITTTDSTTSSFLAYFNGKIQRNWAGPEHWKINRPHLRRALAPTTPSSTSKTKKREFVLDFDVPYIEHTNIFQKANPSTITLSRNALEERNGNNNLLPEDLHFSSTALVNLFLKPTSTISQSSRQVKRPATLTSSIPPTNDKEGELPLELRPSFWATATTTTERPDHNHGTYGNEDYDDDDDGGIYDFGGGVDYDPFIPAPAEPSRLAGEEDSQHANNRELVPIVKASNSLKFLDHARRAKRVDVQELKRALWEEIDGQSQTKLTAPKPARFTNLIDDLPKTHLSPETLRDVSVPYCFICLLHLANEHDLSIKATDDADLVITR